MLVYDVQIATHLTIVVLDINKQNPNNNTTNTIYTLYTLEMSVAAT